MVVKTGMRFIQEQNGNEKVAEELKHLNR